MRTKWRRKTRIVICVLAFSLLLHFSVSRFDNQYSEYLMKSLEGPIKVDDPELLLYIRNEILRPPSDEFYSLRDHIVDRLFDEDSEKFYKKFSVELFSFKRRGFFVEAGALDGESMSNTLWLEKQLQWTGLLVEPDPSSYRLLLKKNRKAWSANVCLSVEKYPKKERLTTRDLISNKQYQNPRLKSVGFIVDERININILNSLYFSYYTSQCVPLESLLLALNVTRVDLLSIDVELIEEEIIRNFDFGRFDIQVIFLEWKKHEKLIWLRSFFENRGYVFIANIRGDIIFVKKGTEYERIMDAKHPNRKMTIWNQNQDPPETIIPNG